jgi:hypothetical protein
MAREKMQTHHRESGRRTIILVAEQTYTRVQKEIHLLLPVIAKLRHAAATKPNEEPCSM